MTCLARGADQVFAHVVFDLGGTIEVVLPAADYSESKIKPDNANEFDVVDAARERGLPVAVVWPDGARRE